MFLRYFPYGTPTYVTAMRVNCHVTVAWHTSLHVKPNRDKCTDGLTRMLPRGIVRYMGEREKRQQIGGEETGRCGCGRRGPSGTGECTYCANDMNASVVQDRKNGPVLDVTEIYRQKA